MSVSELLYEETPLEEMSYEQAFSTLEKIVAALEANKLSLDEAISLFERGQVLLRHCMQHLENAELKVRLLTGGDLSDFAPQV